MGFYNKIILQTTILVLSVISTLSITNSCRSNSLRKCICGKINYEMDKHEQYVVNCTNTGFTSTSMLADLPEETEVLIFNGNHIPELPWNIFGELKDLSMLKTIDMSNNDIKEIKGKSYHHVANVERLILNHNNISISREGDENYHHPRVFSNFINLMELHLTNAFADNTDEALANDLHDIFVNSNLTKLFKIHLEQNEIKGYRDQFVFCDLPSLMDLYLGDNYIPNLNFNITCLKKLRFLDLERNNISSFTEHDLRIFDSMTYPSRNASLIVDFSSNPFRCDGAIQNFYTWLHETNVTIRNREIIQCRQTKGQLKYLFNIKKLSEANNTPVSRAVTVLVIILAIVLVLLLAGYLYLNRENVKNRLEPLFEIVSRKVHYTTIESQDV